jgi:UDP-3-O-[3-hydroxymyristoyl] N-acetylglucosamine deacetylase
MTIGLLGFQTTIAHAVQLSGIGVHSGNPVSMSFQPAEAGTGIIFQRLHDNGSVTELKAVSANVGPTDLCTVLGRTMPQSISTIEHVMAAIYAVGIDNLIVEVDGAEVPIMDGSSAPFIEAIDSVGIKNLGVKRRYIRVIKPVRVEANASWAEFRPYDGTRFEVEVDFDTPLIGRQSWKGDLTAETFTKELSRARTFGFMRDVERLWAAGYALGSSLENSVVISDDHSVINMEGLRYEKDEFVRHKTLDAVGDLALAGAQFIGCYRSYRGGHKVNANALKALLSDPSAYEIVEAPAVRNVVRAREFVPIKQQEFAPWSA